MQEEWRDIPGYEGRYQVSDLGRVRGLKGILSPQLVNSGYLVVHLYATGRKIKLVHRLVADVFCPRPPGATEVNHKNAQKTDNSPTNLEWCDRSKNMCHARDAGIWRPHRNAVIGTCEATGGKVYYASQRDAERILSGTGRQSSAVHHCLVGKKKTAYGFSWERAL